MPWTLSEEIDVILGIYRVKTNARPLDFNVQHDLIYLALKNDVVNPQNKDSVAKF